MLLTHDVYVLPLRNVPGEVLSEEEYYVKRILSARQRYYQIAAEKIYNKNPNYYMYKTFLWKTMGKYDSEKKKSNYCGMADDYSYLVKPREQM